MTHDAPLVDAAFDGDLAQVKKLLKAGADLESVNVAGETALCNAALSGNFALVQFLVERGANPKHVSKKFKTNALHYAVQSDAPRIVEYLLAAGTSPRQKDLFGQTPLDVAMKHRHARVIGLLPGGVVPAAKTRPPPRAPKAAKKLPKLPKLPVTRYGPLRSLEVWRATQSASRLDLAESIAALLGHDWEATRALVGKEGLAELLHLPSAARFVAIPSAAFFAGIRDDEVELAHAQTWQEDFTLESFRANAKGATVSAFLCARAPSSETLLSRKAAEAALARGPFRAMTPLEWELVARDGGDAPFINGRTPKEAEAACAALYGKRFDPKKAQGALGVWGLSLGEWVSKAGNKKLTGACGGAAQLYPWQGDELIDCFAGQREHVNANTENALRFALSLPR